MAKQEKKGSLGKVGRVEREERNTRIVTISLYITLILVLGTIAAGLIFNLVIWPKQPVATVNGQEISTRDFQARVRYEQRALMVQYTQFYSQAAQIQDPNMAAQYNFFLQQIASQLKEETIGRQTLNSMISEIVVLGEAEKLDIHVDQEEVDKLLEESFGYFPNGTPTFEPTVEIFPTSTLNAKQLTIVTAVPSPTATKVPEPTATVEQSGPTPTPFPTVALPSPTPYSLDLYQQDLADNYQSLKAEFNITEDDIRSILYASLVSNQLRDYIGKDVAAEEEQVWVRHILVEDEETALEVLDRLDKGEAWDDLFLEYSSDETAGAGSDLGWMGQNPAEPDITFAAFSLEIGEIDGPVETPEGFHIIQLLGKEIRLLDPYTLENRINEAYTAFIDQAKSEYDIVEMEYWLSRVPEAPVLPSLNTGQ
ncbi:MAG: peptidylprolyl isomerase [Anaerolineae bacterium]|nr:peptidylprolyl isomerase [Anaerolineae bacterium]